MQAFAFQYDLSPASGAAQKVRKASTKGSHVPGKQTFPVARVTTVTGVARVTRVAPVTTVTGVAGVTRVAFVTRVTGVAALVLTSSGGLRRV